MPGWEMLIRKLWKIIKNFAKLSDRQPDQQIEGVMLELRELPTYWKMFYEIFQILLFDGFSKYLLSAKAPRGGGNFLQKS